MDSNAKKYVFEGQHGARIAHREATIRRATHTLDNKRGAHTYAGGRDEEKNKSEEDTHGKIAKRLLLLAYRS